MKDYSQFLEVGSGSGGNLLALAIRHPNLSFWGIEYAQRGNQLSKVILECIPDELYSHAGFPHLNQGDRNRISQKLKENVIFLQGSAFQIPLADKSVDLSFTVNVLEQMPHCYCDALLEMRRVTRKYCIFIEPFVEANNFAQLAYLRRVDYFRASYKEFSEFGLKPLVFFVDFPQKVNFGVGLLITEVVG